MSAHANQRQVLTVRRHIPAEPAVVFAAWTEPDQLMCWWGPADVVCTHAEIDLRVGGSFRIANQLPDGQLIWISGSYQEIDPPHRLRHTWLVGEPAGGVPSDVTVTFNPINGGTEIRITHRDIATAADRDSHQHGWQGCLDGLIRHTAD